MKKKIIGSIFIIALVMIISSCTKEDAIAPRKKCSGTHTPDSTSTSDSTRGSRMMVSSMNVKEIFSEKW